MYSSRTLIKYVSPSLVVPSALVALATEDVGILVTITGRKAPWFSSLGTQLFSQARTDCFRIVCRGGNPVPDTGEPGVAGQAQADPPPPAGHQPQARQAEGAPGTN